MFGLMLTSKHKAAMADLKAKAARDLSDLIDERDTYKADATLWRNARDKRAKNRGGGK